MPPKGGVHLRLAISILGEVTLVLGPLAAGEAPCLPADVTYGVGNGPWSVAIGDLDGDGDLDLAVASLGTSGVSILLNGETQPDINSDGVVNSLDLLDLLAAWGPCPPSCPEDLDCSGIVDVSDLLLLLANWG